MNNNQINDIIQGLGVMTELWIITYQNFKKQGFNDSDSILHTKAFMSIVLSSVIGSSGMEADK